MEISLNILTFFLVSFIYFKQVNTSDKKVQLLSPRQTYKIINDLPTNKELHLYLNSLQKIVNFIVENPKCMDFSMKFGIFLLDVNLKPFLEHNLLPNEVRRDLTTLLNQSRTIQDIYSYKTELLRNQYPFDYSITKIYVSLLQDESVWSRRLKRLSLSLLKEPYMYSVRYPPWNEYLDLLAEAVTWLPDPEVYDLCLSALSRNTEVIGRSLPCTVPQECVQMFEIGTNFGYPLTFKLLFLLLARLSRGCSIFSVTQDQRMINFICKNAFRESEYIAKNGFKKVDLMAEHISMCTLDGHAQFVRKSWISVLLKYQSPYGYFTEQILSDNEKKAILLKMKFGSNDSFDDTQENMEDACLKHINAVAVGALSAAVRYILEIIVGSLL